jgi:hypothetical protein
VRYYQVKGWSLSTSLVRITSKTDGFEKWKFGFAEYFEAELLADKVIPKAHKSAKECWKNAKCRPHWWSIVS